MGMILDGHGRREMRKILLEAFTRQKLDRGLAEASPAREFSHLVSESPFEVQVSELIDAAEREGWLNQFGQLLADELPDRKDLQERLTIVLRSASDSAQNPGEDVDAEVAVRSRLLTISAFGVLLGVAGGVLGILAWSANKSYIPLLVAALALLFAFASTMLLVGALLQQSLGNRLGAFSRSKLPIAGLVLLTGFVAINGMLYWQGAGAAPNFILKIIDATDGKQKTLPKQIVQLHELVNPGKEEQRMERRTDLNGEAFFTLRLGTGTLYSGGILIRNGDAWRDCLFPAFPALEERSVVQNVAALNCREGQGSERGLPNPHTILRVGNVNTSSTRSLSAEERSRLPLSLEKRKQRAPLGVPDAPIVFDRIYYSLGYDPVRLVPLWAAFTVSGEPEDTLLEQAHFIADPELPSELLSRIADYENNPYEPGRLVPQVDARSSGQAAEHEASYLAAVVPQARETNRGAWLQIEQLTRELAARGGPVHVLSGPIYAQDSPLVIGQGATPVPVALFRVLLRLAYPGDWRALGFIVTNDGSVVHFSPEDFVVPISEVEKRTGLVFFPDAAGAETTRLKDNADLAAFSR